jgi:hypothetical protein
MAADPTEALVYLLPAPKRHSMVWKSRADGTRPPKRRSERDPIRRPRLPPASQQKGLRGFRRPGFSASATVQGDFHAHQCLVAALALACARKKRIISRLASGPRASV